MTRERLPKQIVYAKVNGKRPTDHEHDACSGVKIIFKLYLRKSIVTDKKLLKVKLKLLFKKNTLVNAKK